MQWYIDETAQSLIHALCQAFMKRGLPRSLLTDNGAAMVAEETTAGLAKLGVLHRTTLPYTPAMNGKQEVLWARVEGRLMAMLDGEENLTLDALNLATQAWVEQEYNRTRHKELDATPLARYMAGPTVARPCPDAATLAASFRVTVKRRQRHSDGTVSPDGKRFEIPSRYRHLDNVHLQYARWDLARVDLIDERTGSILGPVKPIDKSANANSQRRRLAAASDDLTPLPPKGLPALITKQLADYAATGVPPAYITMMDANTPMNHTLLALYGLKWNPFFPELPSEAIYVPPKIENFCWRIEHALVKEGGFAMVHGDRGSGKSIVLRLLAERLKKLPDITVGDIAHPQSSLVDFYRELGDIFGVRCARRTAVIDLRKSEHQLVWPH